MKQIFLGFILSGLILGMTPACGSGGACDEYKSKYEECFGYEVDEAYLEEASDEECQNAMDELADYGC